MKTKILWFLLMLTSLFCVMACGSVKSYSVTYKNISDQDIHNLQGLWGEKCIFFVGIGSVGGMEPDAILSSGRTRGDSICDIPDRVGGRWISADRKNVEYWIPLDTSLIPQLKRSESYQFIVSVRQDDIQQVEVVIHDSNKIRQKKKKVMLYCALPKGCLFNSPFTVDSFYDCDKLTPGQLKKIREENAKKRVIMEKFDMQLRADLSERGIELEERSSSEACPDKE